MSNTRKRHSTDERTAQVGDGQDKESKEKFNGIGVYTWHVTTIGGCTVLSGVMARLIRVEYAGAGHHVTARGNERKAIYRDNADRLRFLETVNEPMTRFGVVGHAYWLLNRWSHSRQTVA